MSVVSPHLAALFIPSPGQGVWHLGPLPIRAYALCIIAGVIAAVWYGERRWVARGGIRGQVSDVAIWAVPFGLVGARLYHVATDHDLYFGAGKHPIEALEIWHGGLGIWGAIAGGALGATIAARRMGIRMLPLMDALAPGLLLAQAIGRWGNYFNQELFGQPTTLPWGLKIDADAPARRLRAVRDLPPDVPLRVPVEPRRHGPRWSGPTAGSGSVRPRVRALRDDLHGRSRLDREPADRHHRARQRARAALGRLDVDHPVRARGGVLPLVAARPSRSGVVAVRRGARPGCRAVGVRAAESHDGTGEEAADDEETRRRPTTTSRPAKPGLLLLLSPTSTKDP